MKFIGTATTKRLIKRLTGSQLALIGFALIALTGALILMLPISSSTGEFTNFIDSLFTSVSAVCVTGLIVEPTGTHWSLFGQIVIILLIQTGGLGFMTFMTMVFISTGRRITIHDRLLIKDSINSDQISGIVSFVKKIIYSALLIELAGAILLSFSFIPTFGWGRGIYFALWHAVSMYCNAGFDLMASVGESSFTAYVSNAYVSLTICALIIIGGLGFSVYVDLIDKFFGRFSRDEKRIRERHLALHTKVVLIMTFVLLVGGSIIFYLNERDNPQTMGNLPEHGKIVASFFQSTTPRTAGANTIDQSKMTGSSQFLTDFLMFIGASPGSTGGGIKTTTVFIILITCWSVLMGRREVNCMRREINILLIKRAMCIVLIGIIFISLIFYFIMRLEPDMRPGYILFEILSAYGTVGLSCGITSELCEASELLLCLCMFIGRVGPLTIAYVITNTEGRLHKNQGHYKLPEGQILIG